MPLTEIFTDDLLQAGQSARGEARSLYRLIGKDGNTVAGIRELIAVPPNLENILREFARRDPAEAHWIATSLRFRKLVARHFERLVMKGCANVDKSRDGEGMDGRGGAHVCPDHGSEQAFADSGNPPVEAMQEGCPQSLVLGQEELSEACSIHAR